MTLPGLLKETLDRGGSDLHLSAGVPPCVRVDGDLQRLPLPVLTPEQTRHLACSGLTDAQRKRFEDDSEIDLALAVEGIGRCRGNVFRKKGTVAAVFRLIPNAIPSLDDLGLPPVIASLADRPRGLILVTGPTGSGKSTTLAAIVDRINATRPVHILTIEDPVEYVHRHKTAVVSQRELGSDTHSFPRALRAALREDPDVVLIGELRDLETMEAALTMAETGHLTLATLHTNSAAQTVTRLVDAFPAHQQAQVRTQLSLVLEGIVCQTLLKAASGGRVAALEILVATPAVRHLIRDDKVHQIYGVMQTGQERGGMQTMNQALGKLVERRIVSREVALAVSAHRDELAALLDRASHGGSLLVRRLGDSRGLR
ncbi:MAG TPA: type IV pilus twitching motility protein PilT [Vicinamibacterales bacterium]|nr:type IV pilus twitching motility protein PilT [Vicinamibacterales bacterium]